MTDRFMRRVWVSPWTMLAATAFYVTVAAEDKRGGWYWFSLAASNLCFYIFIERGSKRWGKP